MHLVRSRLSIGNFIGQRCRPVTDTGSHRGMCSKPQAPNAEPLPAVPAAAPRAGLKPPGCRPSTMDKRMLIWVGRFKTADQIPERVSFEIIDAARTNIRVKMCTAIMVGILVACLLLVFKGKRAVGRHESLTNQNMEKKARWKEELQREKEAALELSAKAQ